MPAKSIFNCNLLQFCQIYHCPLPSTVQFGDVSALYGFMMLCSDIFMDCISLGNYLLEQFSCSSQALRVIMGMK